MHKNSHMRSFKLFLLKPWSRTEEFSRKKDVSIKSMQHLENSFSDKT